MESKAPPGRKRLRLGEDGPGMKWQEEEKSRRRTEFLKEMRGETTDMGEM